MKPWHRSLSFLLGAFVAVCILWLWWDSYRHEAGPTWSFPGHSMYLVTANGEISLMHLRSSDYEFDFSIAYAKDTGGSLEETMGDSCDKWSFGPFRGIEYENRGHTWFLVDGFKGWFVSWWFVFCVYLLAWGGLMAWLRGRAFRAAAVMEWGEA